MKDNHNYDHSHIHSSESYDNIIFTMMLNLIFAIIEIISFFFSGSIAMLSSSIHDFGDVLIFYFTAKVEKYSIKGRDLKYTYGYRRFSVIGAFINSIILIIGSIIIIPNSISRIINPQEITGYVIFIMAILGIIINKIGVKKLKNNNSLVNEQLILNLKSDVYNFYGLLLSSFIIMIFKIQMIDSIFAIIISLMMLYHVYNALKEMFNIIMQSVPDDIDIDEILKKLYSFEKVKNIHDVHLWNLDGEDYIFTCHVVVSDETTLDEVIELRENLRTILAHEQINHSTFEFDNITIAKRNKEM